MSEWDLKQEPNNTPAAQEVGIASLGRRTAAYLINSFLTCLFGIPVTILGTLQFLAYIKSPQLNDMAFLSMYAETNSWFYIALIAFLVYGVVQIWMMSRYGQSIGKRIMNIRVIKTNGTDAGFIGTILLREILFNIVVVIVAGILGSLAGLLLGDNANATVSNLVQSALWITCFVMACDPKRDRRTLQDMLADTVVVALPPKR